MTVCQHAYLHINLHLLCLKPEWHYISLQKVKLVRSRQPNSWLKIEHLELPWLFTFCHKTWRVWYRRERFFLPLYPQALQVSLCILLSSSAPLPTLISGTFPFLRDYNLVTCEQTEADNNFGGEMSQAKIRP